MSATAQVFAFALVLSYTGAPAWAWALFIAIITVDVWGRSLDEPAPPVNGPN